MDFTQEEFHQFFIRGLMFFTMLVLLNSVLNNKHRTFINLGTKDLPYILENYINKNCTTYITSQTKKILINTDEYTEDLVLEYIKPDISLCILVPLGSTIEGKKYDEVFYTDHWQEALRWLNIAGETLD